MKSKASIKSHPIHPILVSFPIAFFIGTLLFDVVGLIFKRYDFHLVAYWLQIAGVGFALLAAVAGIIDYMYTVPPASSAKKRAAKHGLTNTLVVVIFAVTWFYRREGASAYLLTGAEVIGVILMSYAGWLGGTLVYRNQIGVDPRYAYAGKWNEIYVEPAGGQVEVAKVDELKVNQMKLVHLNGKRIVLSRAEEGYFAFDDRCTHKGGSLAGGSMICGTVQCPWHGSQFDVKNGGVKAGPAKEAIQTYPVKEEQGRILLIIGQ